MIQGETIRKRREELGLTQQMLADRLYVTVPAISQWECGKTQPGPDRIKPLAQALGMTADALMDEEGGGRREFALRDRMFSEDHMYGRVKTLAEAEGLTETYRALPYMKECHARQERDPVRGALKGAAYIVHPLTMACHAHAMGIREDAVLAVCLLHDVCEDCGVEPKALPFSEPVRNAVGLLTKDRERVLQVGRAAAAEEYYQGIMSSRIAMLVKCLDRCNNLSTMAGSFSAGRMARYIEETEGYVLPILDDIKNRYLEWKDAAFLLKYQILSLIETQKALLYTAENEEEET